MIHQWLRFFYDWPSGAIWGNVVVVTVLAPVGWIWSRSKWWPLRPIRHAISSVHEKLDARHAEIRAEHERADAHRHWQFLAEHARALGEPVPPHPHFPHPRGDH